MDFGRALIYRANSAWILVGHRFTVPILVFSEWIFVGHRFIVPILVFCLYDPVLSWTTIYRAKIQNHGTVNRCPTSEILYL